MAEIIDMTWVRFNPNRYKGLAIELQFALYTLEWLAHGKGWCHATDRLLAGHLGRGNTFTRRVLAELEDRQLVRADRKHGRRTIYRLSDAPGQITGAAPSHITSDLHSHVTTRVPEGPKSARAREDAQGWAERTGMRGPAPSAPRGLIIQRYG